jgi:Cd2+/Zn2+-exporting ATPase
MMELTYRIDGIDCANCASKLERAIAKLPGVEQAQLNFLTGRLVVSAASDAVHESIVALVQKREPDATLRRA